jgi:hypothetical protein
MKKTYAAPTVTESGDAVHETRGKGIGNELAGAVQQTGSSAVGFNL